MITWGVDGGADTGPHPSHVTASVVHVVRPRTSDEAREPTATPAGWASAAGE